MSKTVGKAFLLIFSLALVSCGSDGPSRVTPRPAFVPRPTGTPLPRPTPKPPHPTPTSTPRPTPTITPKPSPRPTLTPKPTASPTPRPSPTATPTPAPVQLVVNGSFESGYAGWTATGNQRVANIGSGGGNEVQFNDGNLPANGVLSQNFPTVASKTYTLTFELGAFSQMNQDEQRMQVRLEGTGQLFSQAFAVKAPGNGTRYTVNSLSFVADSSSATIQFQDISATTMNVDLLLDNIRITAASAASEVTLSWNANKESDLAGYKLHRGTQIGAYDNHLDVGNVTTATVKSLLAGTTYYFVVTAYNTVAMESDPSNEVMVIR